jgi:predicted RNase H-like HicB family nuclease
MAVEITIAKNKYSAVLTKERNGYVSLCPELDIASQGDSEKGAIQNLEEAVELFLEVAPEEEVLRRFRQVG